MKINVKSFVYFDRSVYKRNWKKFNNSPLKRAGAVVRRIAVNSIRKDHIRKSTGAASGIPSRPGMPPKSRAPGHPFRRIFFDVNRLGDTVIVGPVGFGATRPVTELHEFGGTKRMHGRPLTMQSERLRESGAMHHRNARRGLPKQREKTRKRRARRRVALGIKPRYNANVARGGRVTTSLRQWQHIRSYYDQHGDGEGVKVQYRYQARYPERPYMWPALQKARPYIKDIWKFSFNNARGIRTFNFRVAA